MIFVAKSCISFFDLLISYGFVVVLFLCFDGSVFLGPDLWHS
jgi:hypothetical protein